ncbi:MAG TPA: ectoine hydroxylase [Gammaproteobacteria bacterium]|nr:ectoine hydroxylase [Gammaproteobacteria bacterium]
MTAIAHNAKRTTARDLYPSRTGGDYRLLPRRDPVACGSPGDGPLDKASLDRYIRDGFLHLPGFFTPDAIAPVINELDRMRDDATVTRRKEAITEPGSGALRSLFAVHLLDCATAELCRHPRVVSIVRQILGSAAYILQSRINYKPGFHGREFFWHSDFETWHVEDGLPRMRTLSCSISLTENTVMNGPLMLVPGSHHSFLSCAGETPEENYKRSLKRQDLGVPDSAHLERMVEEGGLASATGPAGSVTFFDCNLMHGSGSNITPWPRSNVFVVFNSVENPLSAPFGGLAPRPEFLAHREVIDAPQPARPEVTLL